MAWGAHSVTDRRREFVRLASREGSNVAELCRRFEVAAKTGHKWLRRWRAEGDAGLEDRSRRPRTSPERTASAVEASVLEVRSAHPAWGGRKIAAALRRQGVASPAPSTITQILRRHGLELGGHGGGVPPFRRFEHAAPNELWQMDFKGHAALEAGGRVHPLTVLDDHSRYCVVLAACSDERTGTVRTHLIEAFRRYGLPRTMISDNGSPWGDGPGTPWTPLGVMLIDQGIRVSHSRPYHPQTLGKDERFHRTLKAEAMAKGMADLAAAARRFEEWRHVYNLQRPHEAIGMAVPAERYAPSPRSYKETVEPFDYAPGDLVRRVEPEGRISYKGRRVRVPKAFRGRDIALRPTETDGLWNVFYRHERIAELDLRGGANGSARRAPCEPALRPPRAPDLPEYAASGDTQTVTHVPEHP